ncbi:MAG: Mur ligase family protein [Hyphomonadaceae bacterium]|nr:Mur ligase family protein [Hyphomonadaceae bacterium]
MTEQKRYFFCGIGGSGMLPLAMILRGQGAEVSGSDRSRDQGRTPEKFDWLEKQGISLFPQDGSGLFSGEQTLVASAAVEDTVPDVAAALRHGCRRVSRAELLSELFNAAQTPIGVAGTSGKSTTTAMIAHILALAGKAPTVMNGAVMKNFLSETHPYASALVGGESGLFVSELDESDGTIALYTPRIAVLNNISVDHKSMEELRALFGDYLARASQLAVLNADDGEVMALAPRARAARTYSIAGLPADVTAEEIAPAPTSIAFTLCDHANGTRLPAQLQVPGRHNVSNALAAICATSDLVGGVEAGVNALTSFQGIKRRFELVGEADGVTVIDDFGHNPDKIAATLSTLHDFPGRILVMFQPHGFGPLRKMRTEFAETFATHLKEEDVLVMPEPVYFGGTVERVVSSADLAADIRAAGRQAVAFETREACGAHLLGLARPGDRLVIMGARDDTLSSFAENLVSSLLCR